MNNTAKILLTLVGVFVIVIPAIFFVFDQTNRRHECDDMHGVLISKNGFTVCVHAVKLQKGS